MGSAPQQAGSPGDSYSGQMQQVNSAFNTPMMQSPSMAPITQLLQQATQPGSVSMGGWDQGSMGTGAQNWMPPQTPQGPTGPQNWMPPQAPQGPTGPQNWMSPQAPQSPPPTQGNPILSPMGQPPTQANPAGAIPQQLATILAGRGYG